MSYVLGQTQKGENEQKVQLPLKVVFLDNDY